MSKIEQLYQEYKHSVPSERSESHLRYYFKALPEKELSDEKWTYTEKLLGMSILFLIYGHMENISFEISNKSRQNGYF